MGFFCKWRVIVKFLTTFLSLYSLSWYVVLRAGGGGGGGGGGGRSVPIHTHPSRGKRGGTVVSKFVGGGKGKEEDPTLGQKRREEKKSVHANTINNALLSF